MKRKIAFLLAAAMTVSMLPMNVFATSSNNTGRTDLTVKTDITDTKNDVAEILFNGEPATLEVRPNNAVESGDSIILNIDNGEFNEDLVNDSDYIWKASDGSTWEDFLASISADSTADEIANAVTVLVKNRASRELPYKVEFVNSTQIQVYLCPLRDKDANEKDNTVADGIPYYNIKLPIDVQDSSEGAVTVSLDNNYTRMSSGSYTVATVTDSDGSTTASVSSSDIRVTSDEDYAVPTITVKEDVVGTFEPGTKITLRVSGNYTITKEGTVSGGLNARNLIPAGAKPTLSSNGRYIEYYIPDGYKSDKVTALDFTGIVVSTDEDDTYGNIEFTVSGSKGITRQTVKVGERADYGFALTALEEVPTIFAGRSFLRDSDLEEDDYVTAEFEFAETTPGTWLDGRKLEFTVPDGVKIVGYEITDHKYISMDPLNSAMITDDGTTLSFSGFKGAIDEKDCSYVDLQLYISAAADFSGDVTVDVAGAGLDKEQLSALTVAKVVSPVTVEAASTTANIGYKAVETADIKITENAYGALLEEPVYIKLDDTYASDIAFDDSEIDYTVDGEVEIKNFKVKSGEITFTVDSSSYNNPSTITITGVKVGTTRSIPYGSYSIIIGDDALVNNYKEDVDVPSKVEVTEGDFLSVDSKEDADGKVSGSEYDLFEVEGFEFKDYLTIKTDPGTLDGKVEVTIGSNTIKMDGQEVTMDTAAYIQTASNSTMVPLRFVALAIGVDQAAVEDADNTSKITWDANNKIATILYAAGNGQKIIQFQANSPVMVIDGTAITMENGVKAEIVDGRMFVPFRALGTALGVPVSWDAETRTAIYN